MEATANVILAQQFQQDGCKNPKMPQKSKNVPQRKPPMNPSSPNSLAIAADWSAQLVTGSLATAIAILAIAMVGFAMLLGKASVRDGGRIILGCFIVFGAPSIAQAFLHRTPPAARQSTEVFSQPSNFYPPSTPSGAKDPYAGASLPQ